MIKLNRYVSIIARSTNVIFTQTLQRKCMGQWIQEQHHLRNIHHWSSVSSRCHSTAVRSDFSDASVTVEINGKPRELNSFWLRDNCRCSICFNHETSQRNNPLCLTGSGIDKVTQASGVLHITWSNGHRSSYELDWLNKHYYPGSTLRNTSQFLWDKKLIQKEQMPLVSYEEYMNDSGLGALLRSLLKYGFGMVTGVPGNIDATQMVVEKICHIEVTLFGKMWSFTANMAHSDTAYTNLGLGAHTDTTYFSSPMGIQVFHKLHHDGEGGETLLVDGFHAAEKLRQEDPASFKALCDFRVEHEYEDKKNAQHIMSLSPILQTHPVTGIMESIRYNHYDRAPIRTVPPEDLLTYYQALTALSGHIESPASQHWISLQPGTVLFIDNWRVLHGRAAFTGTRKVCGCYLPRDDWLSKARTMNML